MAVPVIDPAWLIGLIAALLATGAVGGLLAGLLGVGGGIVIVPVLFQIFTGLEIDEAVRMHLAVGTSLATIIPTSISSTRAHWRRGSVDTDLLKTWGPLVFLGVIAGSAIAGYVGGVVLTALFAVVATAVAANMAFRKEPKESVERLPKGPIRWVIGGLIGLISSMMGIGGGSLSVPTLSLCGQPIRTAVGTSAAIGLIIAVPGAIGFVIVGWDEPGLPVGSAGYVSLIGFACIVPATILAAPWGAKLAHAIDPNWLRRAFALFLFLSALKMVWDLA